MQLRFRKLAKALLNLFAGDGFVQINLVVGRHVLSSLSLVCWPWRPSQASPFRPVEWRLSGAPIITSAFYFLHSNLTFHFGGNLVRPAKFLHNVAPQNPLMPICLR